MEFVYRNEDTIAYNVNFTRNHPHWGKGLCLETKFITLDLSDAGSVRDFVRK